MKTTIQKKILALGALVLSGLLMTSGVSALYGGGGYNNTNYNNDSVSYANAGPGGATAYYSNNTDYNSTNYSNNNCGFGRNCGSITNGYTFPRSYNYQNFHRFNDNNRHHNYSINRWHNRWDDCD